MEKITRILDRKQPHFKAVSPFSTINDALCRMNFENTDHLIVMDENENYLGVITEHDIASKSLFSKLSPAQILVKNVMNSCLPIAFTEDTVDECMQRMQRYHVRLLPVFEGHRFKGVVTTEDILYEAVWHRNEIFDTEKMAEIISY
jgi:signal-transduction protein with cAMP-binding, CBS, and nucleotidyltransferase domain